jgi:hypothetical protein
MVRKTTSASDRDDIDVRVASPWRVHPPAVAYAVAAGYDSTEAAGRALVVTTTHTIDEIGRPDDMAEVRRAVGAYSDSSIECGPLSAEARWCARAVADAIDAWSQTSIFVGGAGHPNMRMACLAEAWHLVATDPASNRELLKAAYTVSMSADLYEPRDKAESLSRAAVVSAWQSLAVRPPPVTEPAADLWGFVRMAALKFICVADDAAQEAAEAHAPAAGSDVSGGIVVLKSLGGLSKTNAGRDAAKEFEAIVGKPIPRIRVPSDIAIVRALLVAEFPYAERAIVSLLTDLAPMEWVRFRPTLLVGAAGAGKSRLVRRVAEEVGVHLSRYDCSSSADNAIGGTPRRWASTEPAWPTLAVKNSCTANPLVMLDELDKVGTSDHNGRLDMALLPMLEPETARVYPDPFVQAPVDLSWVSWIATANDDSKVPPTLRDRMRILRIPRPRAQHLPALVRSICSEVVAEQGFDPRWAAGGLDCDETEIAAKLWRGGGSVRRLRAIVERLIARRDATAARH